MISKIIRVGAQDELNKAVGRLITAWEDRSHVKEAASRLFSKSDLLEHAPPAGHFMTHIVAMGSDEMYGWNRNNDGWPHEGLKNKHATFVTHAKNYREHDNKDPEKAIGKIAACRYDADDTQRVELILHTKIALAEEEFEKARAGEEMSGSMAANLPEDRCNACEHISKTANDRCDCILYQSGQWIPGKRKYAYMLNDDPTFKDYSWVSRPADRIAWYLEYGLPSLSKAASAGNTEHLRGDQLARAYGMNREAELYALAEIEKMAAWDTLEEGDPNLSVMPRAFNGQFPDTLVHKMANARPETWMRQLIDKDMVMPLETFHAVITDGSVSKSAMDQSVQIAKQAMPQIRKITIRRIKLDPEFGGMFGQAVNEFEPEGGCSCSGDIIDGMMEKVREQFSTRYADLCKRALHNEARTIQKTAAVDDQAFATGVLYQAYLVKTAEHIARKTAPEENSKLLPALLAWAH